MDSRRVSRMVIGPKVRQVGFVTPGAHDQMRLVANEVEIDSPVLEVSPAGNSLSPVMIPPPRHSESSRPVPVPLPQSPLHRTSIADNMPVGSYNPSESLLGSSISPSNDDRDFNSIASVDLSEEISPRRFRRSNSGVSDRNKVAVSLPSGGGDAMAMRTASVNASSPVGRNLRNVIMVKVAGGMQGGELTETQVEQNAGSKLSLKEKTTKAQRRAQQEAQRAAKAAAKETGEPKSSTAPGRGISGNIKQAKVPKPSSQKKDVPSVTPSVAPSHDRLTEKEKKKDVPGPRMQFDDKQRVEKAQKRAQKHALVKQTEARNRVELFRHLPQYVHGTLVLDLESKHFLVDQMQLHPAVYKVGLQYLAGDFSGGNARCVAMLLAFQEAIKDYTTPPEKALSRDLTAKISSYVSFLITCRPLSISMGNAIRFLKSRIGSLSVALSESEAKTALLSDINRFIYEKIIVADKVITRHAVTKIRDGDVLLTYGSSCVVEMVLSYAHELGKQFRVVVVDSSPKLEGQALLRRLLAKGLSCSYTHINAVSHIMHEVTRVFLGAASVFANGTVYSRVGTASVAMVAHAFHVPVIICCEAYKFHERVQLDSICSNELGDPDALLKVHGKPGLNHLENLANNENLRLLNLIYDATPSDYVSMIVTDYGMVPPTSVPVIVREYRREQLLI